MINAQVAIQCKHPETHKLGCWLFTGPSPRIIGTSVSPVHEDLVALFKWAGDNGWLPSGYDYIKHETHPHPPS